MRKECVLKRDNVFIVLLKSILYAAAALAWTWAAIVTLGIWTLPMAVVIPIPFTVMYIKDKGGFAVLTALYAAGLYMIFGIETAAAFTAMLIPPVLAVAYVTLKKSGFYESVLISALAVAAGLALMLGVFWLFVRGDIVAEGVAVLRSYFETETGGYLAKAHYVYYKLLDTANTGIINEVLMIPGPISADMLDYTMKNLEFAFRVGILPLMARYSIFGGLINYIVVRWRAKRAGMAVRGIPPLRLWKMPKVLIRGIIIMLVALLITYFVDNAAMDVAGSAIYGMLEVIFGVLGICFLDFFITSKMAKKGGRVAMLTLISVVFADILMLVGAIEYIFKLRDRAVIKG